MVSMGHCTFEEHRQAGNTAGSGTAQAEGRAARATLELMRGTCHRWASSMDDGRGRGRGWGWLTGHASARRPRTDSTTRSDHEQGRSKGGLTSSFSATREERRLLRTRRRSARGTIPPEWEKPSAPAEAGGGAQEALHRNSGRMWRGRSDKCTYSGGGFLLAATH